MFEIQRLFNRLGGLHVSDPSYENRVEHKNKACVLLLDITPQFFVDLIQRKCKIITACMGTYLVGRKCLEKNVSYFPQ